MLLKIVYREEKLYMKFKLGMKKAFLMSAIALLSAGVAFHDTAYTENNVVHASNTRYLRSQERPREVTPSNWNNRLGYTVSNVSEAEGLGPLYESGRFLIYGVDTDNTRINSNRELEIAGWSFLYNYTHSISGNNYATYIVLKNSDNPNDVLIYKGQQETSNITGYFIWGANNPTRRCSLNDSGLDSPVSLADSPNACYQDARNTAFNVRIPLDEVFSPGNEHKEYDMYIVTSVGGENNRIIYQKLSMGANQTRNFDGTYNRGTAVMYGGDSPSSVRVRSHDLLRFRFPHHLGFHVHTAAQDESMTELASYFSNNSNYGILRSYTRDSLYAMNSRNTMLSTANPDLVPRWANILVRRYRSWDEFDSSQARHFNRGLHNVVGRARIDGMVLTEIRQANNNSNRAWTNPAYLDNLGQQATLSYNLTHKKFNVNFMQLSDSSRNIAPSVVREVSSGSTYTIGTNNFATRIGSDGRLYHRIHSGSNINRQFNLSSQPSDVNLYYERVVSVPVRFRDSQTGNTLQQNTININAGDSRTFNYSAGNTLNIGGNVYRIADNVNTTRTFSTGLSTSQFAALGEPIDVYVEAQSEIALNIRHVGVDVNHNIIRNFSMHSFSNIRTYPSDDPIRARLRAAGVDVNIPSVVDFTNSQHENRSPAMVSGNWFYTGKGIKVNGTEILEHDMGDSMNDGYDDLLIDADSDDVEVTFYYMQEIDDPSTPGIEFEGGTPRSAGEFNWFLTKPIANPNIASSSYDSIVELNNTVKLTGTEAANAYAYRSGLSEIRVGGEVVAANVDNRIHYNIPRARQLIQESYGNGVSPAQTRRVIAENDTIVTNPRSERDFMRRDVHAELDSEKARDLKDEDVEMIFTYEFTNGFSHVYEPVDEFTYDGRVFKYQYSHTNTEWSPSITRTIRTNDSTTLNHNLDEVINFNDSDTHELVIGGRRVVTNGINAQVSLNPITETFRDNTLKNESKLDTQGRINMTGFFEYENNADSDGNETMDRVNTSTYVGNLGNFIHYRNGFNKYLVPEVEPQFRNVSSSDTKSKLNIDATVLDKLSEVNPSLLDDANYQIGLNISNAVTNPNAQMLVPNMSYLMLENSGFVVEAPLSVTTQSGREHYARNAYKDAFGEETDERLATNVTSNYYVPIDNESQLVAGESYNNTYLLEKAGLNDVTVVAQHEFEFGQYLLGSATQDSIVFGTQKSPLIEKGTGYSGQTVITPETKEQIKALNYDRNNRASEVRSADSLGFWNSMRGLLPSWNRHQ